MSDDWKWVLRSSAATRPVLRFIERQIDPRRVLLEHTSAFSETRGLLRVSAGEGPLGSSVGNEAGYGDGIRARHLVIWQQSAPGQRQCRIRVGYRRAFAAFRTSYSRNFAGGNPEVSVTMRQLYLPARLSSALAGNESALPMLRSMSAGFDNSVQIAENVTAKYGFTMDASLSWTI